MDTITRRASLEALHRIRAQRAEWEESAGQYAREGFRPRTCVHGTSLWVDYDPICGPCEDGLSDHEVALIAGRHRAKQVHEMIAVVTSFVASARTLGAPESVTRAAMDWLLSELPEVPR